MSTPPLSESSSPPGEPVVELLEVMRRLRAECDWKAAQTHRSLARYLVEETHETLEAIDVGDATGDWSHLREELGDLLLQVYFHAVVAEQAGSFGFDDVAADIVAKLRRRNPHVFGSASASGPVAVNELWEQVKAAEKPRASVTDGLPPGLPALLYADKVLARLERAGVAVPVGRAASQPSAAAASAPSVGAAGAAVAAVPIGRAASQPSAAAASAPAAAAAVAAVPIGRAATQPSAAAASAPSVGAAGAAVTVGDRLLALVAEARAEGVDAEQALRDAVRRLVPGPTPPEPSGNERAHVAGGRGPERG